MSKSIRIGTRDSALALWQANTFQNLLRSKGYSSKIIPIKSQGDLNLVQPLYKMGLTGIFTKTLDAALLSNQIDLAVHSMKDVPTILPKGIKQAAVLKRGSTHDILVQKKNVIPLELPSIIATGSFRRKAQWLAKFPNHSIVPLRGNIQTRLAKLKSENWNGAIFAEAALFRLQIENEYITTLDWMIPAPAQGALMITCKSENTALQKIVCQFNDPTDELCTKIERNFLSTLEGGCTAPIGALAKLNKNKISFTGGVFSLDGKQKFLTTSTFPLKEAKNKGIELAEKLLEEGAATLLQEIKSFQ